MCCVLGAAVEKMVIIIKFDWLWVGVWVGGLNGPLACLLVTAPV